MHDFFNLTSIDSAKNLLIHAWNPQPAATEHVFLQDALGRLLAAPVASPEHIPPYDRSTVDGYAVASSDTFGASESLPAILTLVEDIPMGAIPKMPIASGETSAIPTGGALPKGADAAVMVEHTSMLDEGTVLVYSPVSPGENVVGKGEDIRQGESVLDPGHLLRPCDIGALAALGIVSVPVVSRVKVAIISTGDEIIDPHENPSPGEIRDINAYSLAAAVRQAGGEPVTLGISPDSYTKLRALVEKGLEEADMVMISGGSSVGQKDVSVDVINEFGPPGVLVHGIAVKPGKPIILGLCRGKPVFGLPGHPVSALLAFDLFVRFAISSVYRLSSAHGTPQDAWVKANLARNMASFPGRQVVFPVRLRSQEDGLWADPVLGKSGLISTLVRADGEVCISEDSEGLLAGTQVWVRLWEGSRIPPQSRIILAGNGEDAESRSDGGCGK